MIGKAGYVPLGAEEDEWMIERYKIISSPDVVDEKLKTTDAKNRK